MIKKPFSYPEIVRLFASWTILSFAVLACGIGGASPETSGPVEQSAPFILPTNSSAEVPDKENAPPVILPPTQTLPSVSLPSIPEKRSLTLEYPPRIRAGDSDVVRLTLELEDLRGIVPTAETEGNVVTGETVEIPNLFETHHVIAEADFEIAGLQVVPPETVSQTLLEGQAVPFNWSVRPESAGVYRGTVWFYLRFVDKISGEESRKTISAQLVQIEAVNFLGLSVGVVRTFGGIGSVVGAVVGFPFFEDIVKIIFGRRGNRPK